MHYIECISIFKSRKQGLKISKGDFPGNPVMKTPRFHCGGTSLILAQGTNVPHAAQHRKKTKKIITYFEKKKKKTCFLNQQRPKHLQCQFRR